MMIFICTQEFQTYTKNVMVIPDKKIDLVKMHGNEIRIYYRTGTYDTFDEEAQNFAPIERQTSATIYYNSEEDALNAIREFYKALQSKQGAFTFKRFESEIADIKDER